MKGSYMKKSFSATTMTTNWQKKWRLLLLIFFVLTGRVTSFSINAQPRNFGIVEQQQRHKIVKPEVPVAVTALQLSSFGARPDNDQGPNFLTKMGEKIRSWLPWLKKEETEEDKELEKDLRQQRLVRAERRGQLAKEMNEALFPWPMRSLTNSITRAVDHELAKEERKAKPLLKKAMGLIRADGDVRAALGMPITLGPIVSQSSTEIWIKGKKTRRIVDTFEVIGSKKTGVAIMTADKYAKKNLQSLRVNVRGIHYDIDCK